MPNNLTKFSRRRLFAATGAVAALGGFPSIVRAQAKELVIGGAAGFAPWMNGTVSQAFEAKYKTKIVYEGSRSLVNLEKMVSNIGLYESLGYRETDREAIEGRHVVRMRKEL